MFQRTLAFLFSFMLISTAARADQNALTDVESVDEAVQEQLIDDPDDDSDDGIGPQLKRQPPPNVTCPTGFTYVPVARSCYMVVYESHNWWAASAKCQQLVYGAHLVTITSAAENDALKTFLAYQTPNHPACNQHGQVHTGGFYWTAGQRENEKRCKRRKSYFVWRPTSGVQLGLQFSYWLPREPNCVGRKEHCMVIWPMKGFGWNDIQCDSRVCPLCEYTPR